MRQASAPASPTSNISSCRAKLDHLDFMFWFSIVTMTVLVLHGTTRMGFQRQFVWGKKRDFHLNLLPALDHPLPRCHLADVHQRAVGQQGAQLSYKVVGLAHLDLIYGLKVLEQILFQRRPFSLEVHVVELDSNIAPHVTKALLSKSYKEFREDLG